MVGNQPGFEEATRALFAGDAEDFEAESEVWPPDLRDYSRRLDADALQAKGTSSENYSGGTSC